ncbi:MAG: hypothetical protein O2999_14970 [Nitrospirae bacterium]|nr:hypothetical protein [Nitrospirota bacterium]MDA1305562.1 hypothetical protein [Nitrospirota bacterium]
MKLYRPWVGIGVFISGLLLSSCYSAPRMMTGDEIIENTRHVYPQKTPSAILRAAEKLLVLADGAGFTFTKTSDQVIGQRHWFGHQVSHDWRKGQDRWVVTVQPQEDGTLVKVDVERILYRFMGSDTVRPISPATYFLFWNRLEYLLGISEEWMTCSHLEQAKLAQRTWGKESWFCDFSDDMTPYKF